MRVDARRLAIFTITTGNFRPSARVLLRSARTHHPEADLYMIVVDRVAGSVAEQDGDWIVIGVEELAIANWASLAFRYDRTELSVALKPHAFLHLLDARGYDDVLYFDADTEIHRPLATVRRHLRRGASLVLTPHVTEPLEEMDEPHDISFMRAGIYNLGFLAAARCSESTQTLQWWARRLQYDCVNAQHEGIFLDQKFMDFVPAFAPRAHVSHDRTLNVAYWNLSQRPLGGEPGHWTADGEALTFFHFSGFDPDNPSTLSRHTRRFAGDLPPQLDAFVRRYAALRIAGQAADPLHARYGFERFASGALIHPFIRRFFRAMRRDWPADPFVSFEAFLDEAADGVVRHEPDLLVTRLMKLVFDEMPSLNRRLDLARREDAWELVHWFVFHAERDIGLDQRLVFPALDRMEQARRTNAWASSRTVARNAGVAVIGRLARPDDAGEAARSTLGLLGRRARGVELGTMARCPEADQPGVRIFHIDPENAGSPLPCFECDPGQPVIRIGIPFWGYNRIAQPWLAAFDGIDEIWAPSRFTQRAFLQQVPDRPVFCVPPPLQAARPRRRDRAEFGIPPANFMIFCAFDALSIGRSNPRAALAAFRLFRRHASARPSTLVLHAIGGMTDGADLAAFDREIADERDVVMMREALSREDLCAVLGAADCVLSLHRSEGSALLVAQAMLAGVCVIATDYAATAELVTESTGFPVNCRVTRADAEDCPFGEDQLWADPDIEHAAWCLRHVFDNAKAGSTRSIVSRATDAAARRHAPARLTALLDRGVRPGSW